MQLKPVGRRGLRNPTLNELEDSLPDLAQPVPIVVSLSFSLCTLFRASTFSTLESKRVKWNYACELQLLLDVANRGEFLRRVRKQSELACSWGS